MRQEGHSATVLRYGSGHRGSVEGGSCCQESLPPRNQDFPGALPFLFLSSRGQVRVRFGKLLAILTPPSYHPLPPDVSHLGRVFPSFPSLPHVVSPSQEVWADLVRADPLKAQDGHPLEMFRRIKGRSRIEDATPARKIERQVTTPGPAPVEQDFAGEEPEPADETSPVGSLGYRRNLRDRRTKQSTTRGIEYQVKIDHFQAFISRLCMEKGSESWIYKNCTP